MEATIVGPKEPGILLTTRENWGRLRVIEPAWYITGTGQGPRNFVLDP